MGKNKRKDGEETSLHSAATVCVSGLPYSFTNAQLEEAFSDVGPVWLCFMVTNKGSNEALLLSNCELTHFALPEDANRAIELKNGSTVGGRRITVKQATHRPSLKERRSKAAQGISVPDNFPETDTQADKETCSDKQRVARTVIFGGLVNADMAEAVHSRVKEIGTVCSVRYPSPKKSFNKMGSKAQKWKLIIRNLPFKAKPSEIKEVFSAVGFVWDVFVPKNLETLNYIGRLPKGFAFVKFTCKRDAENAIQKFNGHMFSKRPIVVDWAVPKNLYNGAADAVTAPEDVIVYGI
ncbi:hypothetical protein Bca52824_046259 [Brassica carinata]|uniref:RRM domain-containing protein n=1 Tax=Brassica carinata TaxID=52824 RepID=A0A8X7RE52_BRACI|nr:hypothetical protein Bca52824_046259 [Brassica carinata]